MRLEDLTTDAALLSELGLRLERQRLERNLSQERLAELAGIGRATLQRLERGESVQLGSLIKVLRTLGLLPGLDAAIPEKVILPIARLEREQRGKTRQRVRARVRGDDGGGSDESLPPGAGKPWTWGDEGAAAASKVQGVAESDGSRADGSGTDGA